MPTPEFDTVSAFEFYQSIAARLPQSRTQAMQPVRSVENLLEIADKIDVFVFDAFGVLNVGHRAIDGAARCIAELRDRGKQLIVLTNGASLTRIATEQKILDFGFDFTPDEIVSSRFAAECAISKSHPHWTDSTLWGAITGGKSSVNDLQVNAISLDSVGDHFSQVDAFLFLSSSLWTSELQQRLFESLRHKPRPLVVANPDVVAPREAGYSLEPGYFVHDILDRLAPLGVELPVFFYGKPYDDVYEEVRRRLSSDIEASRILMLGDTLHTDILGANNQGWQSGLVANHGLFRGHDTAPFIRQSGIQPDWVMPGIERMA